MWNIIHFVDWSKPSSFQRDSAQRAVVGTAVTTSRLTSPIRTEPRPTGPESRRQVVVFWSWTSARIDGVSAAGGGKMLLDLLLRRYNMTFDLGTASTRSQLQPG